MAKNSPSSNSVLRSATIRARGHANIKGTHRKTFELTGDADVTEAGTCIVGVAAEASTDDLLSVRGAVEIELRCGAVTDWVQASMNPLFIVGDPLIIRIHPAAQHRSLCIAASKGASALDRELVDALRAPNAELIVTIREKQQQGETKGALFVVGTPIGDRRDLAPRAAATLASVDAVLAEDTRTARAFLGKGHAQIISLHEHNERVRIPDVLNRLAGGGKIALISEAGMPLISDPGFNTVRAVVSEGHHVVPLPGPDAVTAALSISGMPTNEFRFIGFLPRKRGARRKRLGQLKEAEYSVVFFESPHRIVESLVAVSEELGDRPIAVCRNMTKPGEEVLRGCADAVAAELGNRDVVRGEFTVVVGPGTAVKAADIAPELQRMAESLIAGGVSTKTIAAALAQATGLPRREMFARVVALRQPDTSTPDKSG